MNRTLLARSASATAGVAALLVLAGCGGGSSSTTATQPSTPASSPSSSSSSSSSPGTAAAMITIKNFAYSGPSSVKPGATVTVMNQDSEAHTVTADGAGGFDVKVDPGKSVTFKAPTKPGSYPYHCNYHSNMHGTLKVG